MAEVYSKTRSNVHCLPKRWKTLQVSTMLSLEMIRAMQLEGTSRPL